MRTTLQHYTGIVLSYGILAGLLIIIVRAAVYLFNVNPMENISFGIFNFVYNIVVLSICLYYGIVAIRKLNDISNLTYAKGFLTGIAIGIVVVSLMYVYDLIFYILIFPDYLYNMIEPQIAVIANNPSITPIQKAELLSKLQKYESPFYYCSMNALMSLGISFLIALVTAFFTTAKRPVIIENNKENN